MYFLQFPTQNDWYSNGSYHLGKSEELFLRHCGKIMNCIVMRRNVYNRRFKDGVFSNTTVRTSNHVLCYGTLYEYGNSFV